MIELLEKDLFEESGAVFSDCNKYRFRLWRTWDRLRPVITFIMLNPSTADAKKNDPTVARLAWRSIKMGFGRLNVVNIFAFRSTFPWEMRAAADPIGPGNDDHILEMAKGSGMVVAAWGNHGKHLDRSAKVLSLLKKNKIPLYHFGLTNTGEPRHPLYVSYKTEPKLWEACKMDKEYYDLQYEAWKRGENPDRIDPDRFENLKAVGHDPEEITLEMMLPEERKETDADLQR